jgi:hypothetical protein
MNYTIPNSKLFYSAAAIGRILEVGARNITEVQVKGDLVHFRYQNEARTLPKQALLNEFVRFRQTNGDRLRELGLLTQDSQTRFSCKSQKKVRKGEGTETETYLIEVTAQGVNCTCEDYAKQKEEINTGVCKHGYAVLGYLGFRTLAEFTTMVNQKTAELAEEARRNEANQARFNNAKLGRRPQPMTHKGVSFD